MSKSKTIYPPKPIGYSEMFRAWVTASDNGRGTLPEMIAESRQTRRQMLLAWMHDEFDYPYEKILVQNVIEMLHFTGRTVRPYKD